MIYGRCGQPVTIVRVAVLDDVKRLDGRKPDKQDREAIENGSYVVVSDEGQERLYHQAFLRADNGAREIDEAIRASGVNLCERCEREPATTEHHDMPLCEGCADSIGEAQDERAARDV